MPKLFVIASTELSSEAHAGNRNHGRVRGTGVHHDDGHPLRGVEPRLLDGVVCVTDLTSIEYRRRWAEGFDAAMDTLKGSPVDPRLVDALLRVAPDVDDDVAYDSGFRSCLAAWRLVAP